MAEEEKEKETERPAEAKDKKAEEDSSDVPAKKGLPKKAIFMAGGVVVIIILAVVAYLVIVPSTQAGPEDGDPEAVAAEDQEGQAAEDASSSERTSRSSHSSRRGSEEKKPSTNIFMTDFPASVVNLGLSEKYDYVYLKYGFNLELDSDKVRSEIAVQLPKLISIVDGVMSGQQWDKIGNARGRQQLADDVADAINDHLETGEVIAVHFNTLVAQ